MLTIVLAGYRPLRIPLLAALALLLAAPPAVQAAAFDVPYPPTEGVRLTVKEEQVTMRVSAKTFRSIAGKRALMRCSA